ncbi:MAG TPA: C40 family peptidase [Pseudomonadales bacterium]|nr:C40 family peptidase [Pseudomonadales bacterium]
MQISTPYTLAALGLMTLLMMGCATSPTASVNPAQANEVTFTAMQQVGKPYRYGGSSPQTGFDCSGLVGYVYRESVGIKLPRSVKDLSAMPAPAVDKNHLETGDLVIFATRHGKQADHAGIFVGKGRFVHAPSTGGKVRLDTINDDYWRNSFLIGKRPLAKNH